ncbi:MAG: DUF4428 domain-containing protein [Solobacterium sp.]|nr:DUF4428 domain-containing protein [Solobacterium sp.]
MGLFDAKYCDICGNKLGILGNTKVEDGQLCKECGGKLSPYFRPRHQTLENVKKHLNYREQNQQALASFKPDKVYGNGKKIYVDTAGRRFAVSRSSDLLKNNADIISFDDVQKIARDIVEDRDEILKEGEDGKKIPYVPPRFEYEYSVYVKMSVANANIDSEISAELSEGDRADHKFRDSFKKYCAEAKEFVNAVKPGTIEEEEKTEGKPVTAAVRPEAPKPAAAQAKAETLTKYKKIIRCAKCGYTSNGPEIPKFCPDCGDAITLDDIDILEVKPKPAAAALFK